MLKRRRKRFCFSTQQFGSRLVFSHVVSGNEVNMDHNAAYPELDQFIGGNFHQDWTVDAEERGDALHTDSVVLQVFAHVNAAYLMALKEDINGLLACNYNEEELRGVIHDEFDGNVEPSIEGSSMQEWLEHVRHMIDEALIRLGHL